MIKIRTLIENNIDENKRLINEHGLSLLIEVNNKRFLFDTGQTSCFLSNANNLNIRLDNLDGIILSHGHYDHTGGIIDLLAQNPSVNNLYISKYFFNNKYKRLEDNSYKYNGVPFKKEDIEKLADIKLIDANIYKLTQDIYICSNFEMNNEYEKLKDSMLVKTKSDYQIDDFKDEICMAINTDKGLIIIAGCSHRGIVNIITTIKNRLNTNIRGVIGGTHLINCSKERLSFTIEALKKLNLEFLAVSHCTGDTNLSILKENFKDKFVLNNTGNTIVID